MGVLRFEKLDARCERKEKIGIYLNVFKVV